MVAKILHTAGLYLGPAADLAPRNPGTSEEHWENKRFVKINAGIISRFYGSWDAPPQIPEDWVDPRLAPFRQAARGLLNDFEGHDPWGWKDPRNCLTLPFWQSLLDPLPVIIVVRNPLEVAKSLRERNGFSLALGLTLWKVYNRQLCTATGPSMRIVTHYEAYFQNPERELSRVLDFLRLPMDHEVIARVRSVHDAQLRHHQMSTADLEAPDVDPAIIDLYRDLCHQADWRDAAAGRTAPAPMAPIVDDDWDDPDASDFTLSREARMTKSGRTSRRRQREEADARITELEKTVESLRHALAEAKGLDGALITS
jgi:hypothetical protein